MTEESLRELGSSDPRFLVYGGVMEVQGNERDDGFGSIAASSLKSPGSQSSLLSSTAPSVCQSSLVSSSSLLPSPSVSSLLPPPMSPFLPPPPPPPLSSSLSLLPSPPSSMILSPSSPSLLPSPTVPSSSSSTSSLLPSPTTASSPLFSSPRYEASNYLHYLKGRFQQGQHHRHHQLHRQQHRQQPHQQYQQYQQHQQQPQQLHQPPHQQQPHQQQPHQHQQSYRRKSESGSGTTQSIEIEDSQRGLLPTSSQVQESDDSTMTLLGMIRRACTPSSPKSSEISSIRESSSSRTDESPAPAASSSTNAIPTMASPLSSASGQLSNNVNTQWVPRVRYRIVLASSSPRRKELLMNSLGLSFLSLQSSSSSTSSSISSSSPSSAGNLANVQQHSRRKNRRRERHRNIVEIFPSEFEENLKKSDFPLPYLYSIETAKMKTIDVVNRLGKIREERERRRLARRKETGRLNGGVSGDLTGSGGQGGVDGGNIGVGSGKIVKMDAGLGDQDELNQKEDTQKRKVCAGGYDDPDFNNDDEIDEASAAATDPDDGGVKRSQKRQKRGAPSSSSLCSPEQPSSLSSSSAASSHSNMSPHPSSSLSCSTPSSSTHEANYQSLLCEIVIGCDTIIEQNGKIFEKPRDEEEAKAFLRSFSGTWHSVHTGVSIHLTLWPRYSRCREYKKNRPLDSKGEGHSAVGEGDSAFNVGLEEIGSKSDSKGGAKGDSGDTDRDDSSDQNNGDRHEHHYGADGDADDTDSDTDDDYDSDDDVATDDGDVGGAKCGGGTAGEDAEITHSVNAGDHDDVSIESIHTDVIPDAAVGLSSSLSSSSSSTLSPSASSPTIFPVSKTSNFWTSTKVKFQRLGENDISEYVALGEWKDKAGGYGIQSLASQFVERLNGCYFNVVGFPLQKISSEIVRMTKEVNRIVRQHFVPAGKL